MSQLRKPFASDEVKELLERYLQNGIEENPSERPLELRRGGFLLS
jgi:hypothetical protein